MECILDVMVVTICHCACYVCIVMFSGCKSGSDFDSVAGSVTVFTGAQALTCAMGDNRGKYRTRVRIVMIMFVVCVHYMLFG